MAHAEVTFVSVRLLSVVPGVATAIYRAMRKVSGVAEHILVEWYSEYHYQKIASSHALQKVETRDLGELLRSLDLKSLVDPLYDKMAVMYEAGTDTPTVGGYRNLNLNMITPDATAVDYAKRRSAELVGKRVLEDGSIIENPNPVYAITEDMREEIRAKVEQALVDGPTPQGLAKEIRSLGAFQPWRARMIARTELAFAYNSGHQDQAERMGFTTKRCVLGDQHDVVDECDLDADQGFIPVHQKFASDDLAPPLHPNCRCDLEYGYEEGDKSPTDKMIEQALKQTSSDVNQEMNKAVSAYVPSTPEVPSPQEPVSTFNELNAFFNKAEDLTPEQEDAEVQAVKDYVKELDERDRKVTEDALQNYMDEGYREVNSFLRGTEGVVEFHTTGEKDVEILKQFVNKQYLGQDTKVYRGLASGFGEATTKLIDTYLADSAQLVNDPLYFSDQGFLSTSTRKRVAGYVALSGQAKRSVMIQLAVPKDVPAASVAEWGIMREHEILLPPGSVLRTVGVDKKMMDVQGKSREWIVLRCVLLPNVTRDEIVDQEGVVVTDFKKLST